MTTPPTYSYTNWAIKATCPDNLSKLLLICLASFADNKTGKCYPSISTLANRTQMSRATVCRKLESLEDANLIVRQRTQFGKPTVYQLVSQGDKVVSHRDRVVSDGDTNLPLTYILSEDWLPSAELMKKINALAFKQNGEVNHDVEVIKFVNHYISKGARLANADAAYTKWCLNAVEFNARKSTSSSGQSRHKGSTSDEHDRRWGEFVSSVRR